MENNLNTKEGLRSIFLEVENFKNLNRMVVEMNGKSMLFIGGNGKGKSSLIQAMQSPLDSKVIPTEPISKGETKAKIVHKIGGTLHGEPVEYTLEIFFTEGNKKGRLVVYNDKGEVQKAPATLMKSLVGNVSFDVNKWINEPKAEKFKVIKSLSGASKEIDLVNVDISKKKEDLKYAKKKAEDLEATLKNHEFSKEEINKYLEPVDVSKLSEELNQVTEDQKTWDRVKNKVDGLKIQLPSIEAAIIGCHNEILRLQELIEVQKKKQEDMLLNSKSILEDVEKGQVWLDSVPRPESSHIVTKMNEASEHNTKHRRILMLSEQQKNMINAKSEVENIKTDVDVLEEKRSKIIKGSQLPIEGVSFDNDELYIDGLPIEEGQLNTQRIWDIGVDIAMALNPNYKVIFLGDGSLFDKEHLKSIIKKIEDKGYMAVVELVDRDGGALETKFFEEEL